MHPLRKLQTRLFSLSTDEVRVEKRGFRVSSDEIRRRIEEIGLAFLHGYHAGLEESDLNRLRSTLEAFDEERRGFAYEGAAMALALLDGLTPWKRTRWTAFAEGPGEPHIYMVHVGAGWALARLHRGVETLLGRTHPVFGWLAVDGFGFHEGYFHGRRTLVEGRVPGKLKGYALRVFDQGLGRSLWFVEGADPGRIHDRIARLCGNRHADLWSGVGLAAAYAGGVDEAALEHLTGLGRRYRADLAQGAMFAAKARARAGNPTPAAESACRVLTGLCADEAARWTDEALDGLSAPGDPDRPAYEVWRHRLRERWTSRAEEARMEEVEATGRGR